MKKWISLIVLGTFASFVGTAVILVSYLTKGLESDIFDIEELDEELF